MSQKRQSRQQETVPDNPPAVAVGPDGRLRQEIELRAYYRYCERGCAPGSDLEDWLAAEQEVLARNRAGEAGAAA